MINKETEEKIVELYNNGLSTVKIGTDFNIHYSSIRKILIKNGVILRSNKINSRKYHVDEDFFETIDTEEKAYWLGFIYADGYVSGCNGKKIGISISSKDEEHLEKFNKSLNSTYPIKKYISNSFDTQSEYCRVVITSEKMYNDLVGNGVFEHKSLILKPPQNVPYTLTRHFIRGYLDGDGTISLNGNSYYVGFMGTKEFLVWLKEYINKNGINFKFNLEQRRDGCDALSFKIHGENAYNFLQLIYSNSTVYLDRKYKRYEDAINYFSRLYQ